ncbi:MAG: methyltransferase domain-containing protein [Saprospiraceae bacterium]|nr:methyltransferase domain-containing protein [Saprospiraceae bacterium]
MGIKLQQKEKLLCTFFYFIDKILPLSKKAKFKFYLNLEWIFDRFSHEYSFKNYSPDIHPVRTTTKRFLLAQLQSHHCVLDLGCNRGDMSAYLADYTNKVVGVDYDKYAIDLAKKSMINQTLILFVTMSTII